MFEQKHTNQIRRTLEAQLAKIILVRAKELEEAYKESPIVDNAKISVNGEVIDVKIDLNFMPKDDEQNIVGVLEAGGVIFDTDNNMHEIEPGYFMRRVIAQGIKE